MYLVVKKVLREEDGFSVFSDAIDCVDDCSMMVVRIKVFWEGTVDAVINVRGDKFDTIVVDLPFTFVDVGILDETLYFRELNVDNIEVGRLDLRVEDIVEEINVEEEEVFPVAIIDVNKVDVEAKCDILFDNMVETDAIVGDIWVEVTSEANNVGVDFKEAVDFTGVNVELNMVVNVDFLVCVDVFIEDDLKVSEEVFINVEEDIDATVEDIWVEVTVEAITEDVNSEEAVDFNEVIVELNMVANVVSLICGVVFLDNDVKASEEVLIFVEEELDVIVDDIWVEVTVDTIDDCVDFEDAVDFMEGNVEFWMVGVDMLVEDCVEAIIVGDVKASEEVFIVAEEEIDVIVDDIWVEVTVETITDTDDDDLEEAVDFTEVNVEVCMVVNVDVLVEDFVEVLIIGDVKASEEVFIVVEEEIDVIVDDIWVEVTDSDEEAVDFTEEDINVVVDEMSVEAVTDVDDKVFVDIIVVDFDELVDFAAEVVVETVDFQVELGSGKNGHYYLISIYFI